MHRPWPLFCRLIMNARMGLAEGFMAGNWDTAPSLQGLFALLIANKSTRRKSAKAVNAITRSDESWVRSP